MRYAAEDVAFFVSRKLKIAIIELTNITSPL